MFPEVLVNGLPLPDDLLVLIAAGRWSAPADRAGFDDIFPEGGRFYAYGVGAMRFETDALTDETSPMWLGEPDDDRPPGDLDPHRAVLIADLGLGSDQPIALDYRVDPTRPRVLTLRWSRFGDRNRWVEIAPDVAAFAARLGL